MSVRVLVADDQPLMRAALRLCLESEDDVEVVGEAGDGAAVVELARSLRPDVVVMDVRMPVLDGIEATRRVVGLPGDRPVRVLVITTFDLDEYVVDAIRAGASGFLLKDATPEDLLRAVRVVADGGALLSPSVTRRLLDLYAGAWPEVSLRPAVPTVPAQVTERELAVLRLVAHGLSNAEIAATLHLAHSSVKTHVSHLLAKLGLADRTQLAVFAYQHDLVRPGETSAGRPPA
jgi:DNA-binding NarL/FixJ family response regulator